MPLAPRLEHGAAAVATSAASRLDKKPTENEGNYLKLRRSVRSLWLESAPKPALDSADGCSCSSIVEDPREAAESETRSNAASPAEARKPPAGTGRGDVIWPGDVDDREDDDWLELCRWWLPVLSLRENGQRQQADSHG